MKFGLYPNMTMAEYLAAPGLNSSSIKLLLESPLTFKRQRDGLIRRETTPAMSMGTALHSAILEGKLDFYTKPDTYANGEKRWNGNATECKQWMAEHSDKPVLDMSESVFVREAVDYVHAHRKVNEHDLLSHGQAEVSAFAEIDGRLFKARFDYLGLTHIADLKTVTDASPKGFSRAVIKYGWHIQAELYRRVASTVNKGFDEFYWIALQKGDLPLVSVIKHGMASSLLGAEALDKALAILDRCEATGIWPEWADETEEIRSLEVPDYLMNDNTQLEDD